MIKSFLEIILQHSKIKLFLKGEDNYFKICLNTHGRLYGFTSLEHREKKKKKKIKLVVSLVGLSVRVVCFSNRCFRFFVLGVAPAYLWNKTTEIIKINIFDYAEYITLKYTPLL